MKIKALTILLSALLAEIVKGWNWDNIQAINLANVQGKGIFVHPVLRKK